MQERMDLDLARTIVRAQLLRVEEQGQLHSNANRRSQCWPVGIAC